MNAMKKMRPILALAALLCAAAANAQQEVMVSQYMFNGLFLNLAYAGSHGYASSSLLHRSQWMQVEGAPRTSLLAIDGPVMNNKMGLGFSLVHDQIGISRDLDMSGHYAYHLRVGKRSKLALGLRAGLSIYSARVSELRHWDAADPLYQQDIVNAPLGKFGFGLYWHSASGYLGISVPAIYAADGRITLDAPQAFKHYYTQHYYVHGGKVIHAGESFDVKPSALVKYTPGAPIEADINCNALYRERIWLGLGYRTGDALVAMAEYQISPQLRIGYAYDMTTSKLRTYTNGSHEVMLGIDFGKDLVRIKTPRYF